MPNSITPPPHLLKKFSTEARDESNKRNGTGYLKTFAKLCIEWANSKSTFSLSQIRSSEIQPPPELVMEWVNNHYGGKVHRDLGGVELSIAAQAAQWGSDEELEACCEWFSADVVSEVIDVVSELRAARRPQPPSMKEQALRELSDAYDSGKIDDTTYNTIRRALEAQ